MPLHASIGILLGERRKLTYSETFKGSIEVPKYRHLMLFQNLNDLHSVMLDVPQDLDETYGSRRLRETHS